MCAMKNILEQVIHKIPGEPVEPKKEKQGYVDLKQKSKVEILELVERQKKLLANKAFINKLPDKGAKILNFKAQLEEEVKKRNESEQLANAMAKLNVNGLGEMDKLEWTGSCNPGHRTAAGDAAPVCDDEEKDDTDPLKLMATHSGTTSNMKIQRIVEQEESLIKPSDLEDVKSNGPIESAAIEDQSVKMETNLPRIIKEEDVKTDPNLSDVAEEPYAKHLCEKYDSSKIPPPKERYLPHRTLKLRDKNEIKVKKPVHPKWEVTAATEPPSVHGDTKMVSLTESVKLQLEQAKKVKEIQMKNATDRLKCFQYVGATSGIGMPSNTSSWTYRDNKEVTSSSDEDEADEAYHDCCEGDDADEKTGGVVFYNLIDN